MQTKIQVIANVRFGAYVKEVPEGCIHYLQVNNYDKENNTILFSNPTLDLNSKTQNHLLYEGDILLAAKGSSNFCVVFHSGKGKAVASSSFLVIRITRPEILFPDFLCWILNREDTMSFIKANAIGTSIPSISKTLIEDLDIDVPSMEVQSKIVSIACLQEREKQLYEAIQILRKKLIQKQLIEILS